MNDPTRPDPDEILSRLRPEKEGRRRGRLKIFFGSSAGVGKTYAMLSAAHDEMEKGRALLVGLVETHGRAETERLLEGLPLLPPLEISYRGVNMKEFDLEAALTRKPDVILVDELAHTNAPGCRHPKRWNDVMELLDAGIDVLTTLNVQHIESLSDLVSGATGIWMKEIVPDIVFDMADDVVLVDIDEDDLIRRLNEGKVYVAPGARARAAEHFFKKSNLSALRELALRRTADRVDAERKSEETAAEAAQPLSEKILVCVGLNALSAKLIRTAKRMAGALKAPWVAVYVDDSGRARLPDDKARYLESLESMVERMGGKAVTLHGEDVADEVTNYARKNRFSKIIVGKSLSPALRHVFQGFHVDQIIRKSGSIDVYVVTDDRLAAREKFSSSPIKDIKPLDYLLTLLTAAGFTIPGLMLEGALARTDQALLYFVGIILVARHFGLGPSLFYALLTASLFNALFLEPFYTLSFHNLAYLFTFLVMSGAGMLVASQVSRLHGMAVSSLKREDKVQKLYMLARSLAAARGRFPVSEIVADYLKQSFDVSVTVWMTNAEGHPSVVLGDLPEETYYKDFGALQWCFENVQNAGRGTATMPSAAGFYVPLASSGGILGVIGIFAKREERSFTREEIASFEMLASLLASALDRVRAGEIAQQVMVEKEETTHQPVFPRGPVEANVLSSVKNIHIVREEEKQPDAQPLPQVKITQSLLSFFDEEKAKSGGSRLNKHPASLLDRVTRVKTRLAPELGRRRIDLHLPVDLPDVLIDSGLFDQALMDILLFALRRSPPLGAVRVEAKRVGSNIAMTIKDKGPHLSESALQNIFDKLEPTAIQDSEEIGVDSSLSVTAGLVRLLNGDITAKNRAITGLQISFTVPIA